MLTNERRGIYLKRQHLAQEYFRQIPESRIELSSWIFGTDAQCEAHLASCGLKDALACNTVACLAGWLFTMPEFCEWRPPNRDGLLSRLEDLGAFLGIEYRSRVFSMRSTYIDGPDARNPAVTDKTLAHRRLDRLIRETKERGTL